MAGPNLHPPSSLTLSGELISGYSNSAVFEVSVSDLRCTSWAKGGIVVPFCHSADAQDGGPERRSPVAPSGETSGSISAHLP
jgi:hypothetical protein